ncbi:MAG: ATP-binding protein, partial [Planctomycetota bacterium]
ELGSFLGLNYPATDIPRQAHRLYLQNWIRLIPDMGYAPVPLIGHEGEGRSKLDLSNALLRSVSPIHIEYLQNMGVAATLTISLPDQRHAESGPERLWGLVACHHYAGSRLMDAARLSVCELIGRQVSSTIAMRLIRQQSDLLAQRRGIQQAVISVTNAALEKSLKLTEALLRDEASILRLVDAAGAAAVGSGGIVSTGSVPSDKALRAIAAHAQTQVAAAVGDDAIFVTDRLTLDEPSLVDEDEVRQLASGVLAMPLSTDGTLLLWVRPEQVHTVNWGGDPNNKATRDIDGRLSPRKSFDRWQEEVRGRSEPWSPEDVASVRELRRALVDIVVRHFEDLTSLNEQLAVSNSELTRFAYAAGHDLREPIRGINSLASFTLEDFGEQLDSEVLDRLKTIQKLTVRTDGLMSSLLRYAKLGQSRLRRTSFSYREVVNEVVETLDVRIRETNATVQVADVLPNIRADRERVYEVVQNLVVNAMKYVSDVDPIVEIGRVKRAAAIAAADSDSARAEANAVGGRHVFFVRDNGIGIPVAQREDVFRIFRRLHSRDAFGGGSGAGLTISKQAVERHGGRMWITGRPDGEQGTTVWFTLEG